MSSQRTVSIDAETVRLIDIFKDLHQNPELGFMEVRTTAIAAGNCWRRLATR